ncbi:mechanosensitive ion channel family protein [Microbacterium sp. M28]|uniref:mechanosensitive ion channel family protein n=1 Tax=Microbacterium sp. M28 TaxID=2962064 RepID=UPI0021F42BE0|nr:mechanosensitive ion channel family protein [Microbacterium sp. M28]UYO95719.1 mechanosensitive ion channel family protein [Microbacterium sp. M28]
MDLTQLIPTNVTAWDVVFAILAVIGGWIAAHYARKGVLTLGRRAPGVSDTMVDIAARLVQYVLVFLGVGIALGFLGASIQPVLAVTIIAAVVIVLVLRGVADNFAAGVLVQSRQPVKLGEEILFEGPDGPLSGVVKDLNGRSVIVTTADGRTVHVPNIKLLSDILVNDSRHGARRSEVQVRVGRGDGRELSSVLALVRDAASRAEGVHARESVTALVREVSDERWILRVRFWHHPLHAVAVTSAVVTVVAAALEDAGIPSVVTDSPVAPPLASPGTL